MPVRKGPKRAILGQECFNAMACELALRVKTEVAGPLEATVVEDGLKEHEINCDELEQEKFTVPLKPFTGETVTLKFAEPPAFTVALVGLTEGVKSDTCSWAIAV
jgi:hypothetical protein